MNRITFLCSVFFSLLCCAGDVDNLNFMGFSEDGKTLAFETYGTQDGSGEPYSTITLVDVEKNKILNTFSSPFSFVGLSETDYSKLSPKVRASALEKAGPTLKQHGITSQNTGEHVVSNLIAHLTERLDKATFACGDIYLGSAGGENICSYELTLKNLPGTNSECQSRGDKVFMFELTLKNRKDNKKQILQKDKKLPGSRGCVLGNAIREVYLYKEKHIAVFLTTNTPGYEGPNISYMVVTAKLN